MYVLLTISLYGRCLSSALVTNVCICLQTVIQEDIFSTLGVILYWAGKKGGEGDIDNISPRTMFQLCIIDNIIHLFTNCYVHIFFFLNRCDSPLDGEKCVCGVEVMDNISNYNYGRRLSSALVTNSCICFTNCYTCKYSRYIFFLIDIAN